MLHGRMDGLNMETPDSVESQLDTFTALGRPNDDTFQVDLRWGPRSDGVGARVGMKNIKC